MRGQRVREQESEGFLEGGTYSCRKPLFFKVSLVTPHTHCLRKLFSVSLLNPSCREDFWQALQARPDTFCILARSPALA